MWVGGDCRLCVAGHFYFGDDVYVALFCVGDDFADVVLGVESAVTFSVVFVWAVAVVSDEGFISPCAYFGEFGILFDFDTPALIVGEVEVEGVHLVHCECVDELEDELFGHEVAGGVEHYASPGESGIVIDSQTRDFPRDIGCGLFAVYFFGEQLEERLRGVEDACRVGGAYVDIGLRDGEAVALWGY